MRTVITGMLNEEFLLPWWLHHHKAIFDHGIIFIDATRQKDSTVELIKEICPTWEVRNVYLKWYDPGEIEPYIRDASKNTTGWRMYLTATEFLLGDINSLTDQKDPTEYQIPSVTFFDWNPTGSLDKNQPLWFQLKMATRSIDHCRQLSNFYIDYTGGFHAHNPNTDNAVIFKYSNAISCPEMLTRRMGFQHNYSPECMKTEGCWQHHNYGRGIWPELLEEYHNRYVHSLVDESACIAKHAVFHNRLIRGYK